jgi:hypothetical protein
MAVLANHAEPEVSTEPASSPPTAYAETSTRAETTAKPSRRRRRRLVVGAGLAVLVAVAVALALADHGHRAKHVPTPAIASQPSAPTSAPPTTTIPTTTIPPTTAPPPTTKAAPLTPSEAGAQLAAAVGQASTDGDLATNAAADLTNQVNALQTAIAAGKPGRVGHMVADFARHVADLATTGQLTPAGSAAIGAPLTALEQLYPSAHVANGGGNQQGDSNS